MVDFPNIKPQSMRVGLTGNTKTFTSTFNQSVTAVEFAGAYMTMSMTFDSLDSGSAYEYDEVNDMSAFLFELGGMSGVAKIPIFHRPGSPAKGNPVTSVADQLGGLLNTTGWTPNTLILKRGQYITVNNELKMVLNDTVSDIAGNSTLAFKPWLRSSPDVGTEVITKDPYGLFRLTDDASELDLEPNNGSVSLEFREAFNV